MQEKKQSNFSILLNEVTDIPVKYGTEIPKVKQQQQRNDDDDDKTQVTQFTY